MKDVKILDADKAQRDSVIGEGAYAKVYKGKYNSQDVVIKVLKDRKNTVHYKE